MAQLYISGEKEYYLKQSLEIEDSINERSTASCIVPDLEGIKNFEKGQPVLIVSNNKAVFGGVVWDCDPELRGNAKFHHLDFVDWHYLADKRIVAMAYDDIDPAVVVKAIIDEYLEEEGVKYIEGGEGQSFLQPELVSTYTIDTSVDSFDNLEQVVLNYVTAASALDALEEAAGAWWKIEPNKNLYFVKREHFNYGKTITLGDIIKDSLSTDISNHKYRNVQWVRGCRDITDEQIEIQFGDGEKHDFALGYRVARKPEIALNYGTAWEDVMVLIKGLEEKRTGKCNVDGTSVVRTDGSEFTDRMVGKIMVINSTRYIVDTVVDTNNITLTTSAGTNNDLDFYFPAWFWEQLGETVTQHREDQILTSTDRVRVKYYGAIDIIIKTEDKEAILEKQAIEGDGTGRVEKVLNASDLTSRKAAFDVGNRKLEKYAIKGKKITFTTLLNDIAPGHLVPVDIPEYGVDNVEMLVEHVAISDPGNVNYLNYTITAVYGPTERSWQSFFGDIAKERDVVRGNIGEDEVLVQFWSYEKNDWNTEPALNNILKTLYPEDEATPASDLYPMYDYEDRIKYAEFVVDGSVALRKQMTTRENMESDPETMVYLNPLEAIGELQEIHWYGGYNATIEEGTGIKVIEVVNEYMPHQKTNVETIEISRKDSW